MATHDRLEPKAPPGRLSRKALGYTNEIHRLKRLGYSLEAIRQALADAGRDVSRSTVRRELARTPSSGSHSDEVASSASLAPPSPRNPLTPSEPLPAPPPPESLLKPRDEAAAYVSRIIHNPLLRNRS